jgi:hypothetical protein
MANWGRDASRMEALRTLWCDAGLVSIETREISVHRTFVDFDDFWAVGMLGSTTGPTIAAMDRRDSELLKTKVHARLKADGKGRITCQARANAMKGLVPS